MAGASVWNPLQYNKFAELRGKPLKDLIQLSIKQLEKYGSNCAKEKKERVAVDLGCGPGKPTAILQQSLNEWTSSLSSDKDFKWKIIGIDNSIDMINSVKSSLESTSELTFKLGELTDFEGKYDLIFSNAALHWASNHESLLKYLIKDKLNENGVLAFQIPNNHNHLSHKLIRDVWVECGYSVSGFDQPFTVLSIQKYAEILYNLTGDNDDNKESLVIPESIHCSEKVYVMEMRDWKDILEWTKGSVLTYYLSQMKSEEEKGIFLDKLSEKYRENFSGSPLLYTYNRIFVSAVKKGQGMKLI